MYAYLLPKVSHLINIRPVNVKNWLSWFDEVSLFFFYFSTDSTYTVPLEKVNQPPLSRVVGFLDLHEKNQDFEACCLQPRGLNLISKYPLQYVIFTHNLFNLSPDTNVGSHFLFKGTVAPDLIGLKVVWLDRPWWV